MAPGEFDALEPPPVRRGQSLWATAFFALCLAALLLLSARLFWPFFTPLAWAAVLSSVAAPMADRIQRRIGGRRRVAALLACVVVCCVLVVPAVVLIIQLARESAEAYSQFEAWIRSPDVQSSLRQWQQDVTAWLGQRGGRIPEDWSPESALLGALGAGREFLVQRASGVVTGFAGFVIRWLLTLLVLYFMLVDGRDWLRQFSRLLPLPRDRKQLLGRTIRDVTAATVYTSLATGLAQGTVGAIVLWALGVATPLLWGATMVVAAFIPMAGAGLVWVPISVYLLVTGHAIKAGLLVAAGVLVIGLIDNVLRPWLLQGRSRLHPLILLLAILGGIQAFGMVGIVLGPLIVSVLQAFLEFYRRMLTAEPSPALKAVGAA